MLASYSGKRPSSGTRTGSLGMSGPCGATSCAREVARAGSIEAVGTVMDCLSATLRATGCTGPSHELAATTPVTVPGYATLPVNAGICNTPNMKADKLGGGVLAALALPRSGGGALVGGCTIRGMPAGTDSSIEGIGVTTAAPGIPRRVCNR